MFIRRRRLKAVNIKSYICTGLFYSFFSADEVKAPLSFYNAIGMFYDGLPFFVGEGIGLDVLFVFFYVELILAALNVGRQIIFLRVLCSKFGAVTRTLFVSWN